MKVLLTLDYELFFGAQSGSVEHCMLEPTRRLVRKLDAFDVKATFFVDAGYIIRADELDCDRQSVAAVRKQLRQLSQEGHDIQLHIHPHWFASHKTESRWNFDLRYYKLVDYSQEHAASIIARSADALEDITGIRPFAYRAGGWCLQPFSHAADALYDTGVRLDSTVYIDGRNDSPVQGFDFSGAPRLSSWKFDNDPLVPVANGRFCELPISSAVLSPLFFWRLALAKKLGRATLRPFGDGQPVPISRPQLLRLMTRPSRSVASIDGYKARLLSIFRHQHEDMLGADAPLVLMGHPKSLSEYSLRQLELYLEQTNYSDDYVTVSNWFQTAC